MKTFFLICFIVLPLSLSAMNGVIRDDTSDTDSVITTENIETYLRTKINSGWANAREFNNEFGFKFSEDRLYVFAFNTGQANCIILRKGSHTVIFDAGGDFPSDIEEDKAKSLLKETVVDAVFITHPHEDHFSLIPEVFGQYLDENTIFFLGGTVADWTNERCELLKQALNIIENPDRLNASIIEQFSDIELSSRSNENIRDYICQQLMSLLSEEEEEKEGSLENLRLYLDRRLDALSKFMRCVQNSNFIGGLDFFDESHVKELDLLDGVAFFIFNGGMPSNPNNANQKSFITKVKFGNRSILFTGDAEGEELERHIGPFFLNLAQAIKLMTISHGVDVEVFLETWESFLQTRDGNAFLEIYDAINQQMDSILPIFSKNDIVQLEKFVSTIPANIRLELKSSDLIFLPHHGTNTANSQRWIGYFANDRMGHTFVISSSPFGKDCLPKRSSIEFIPELPLHLSHTIVYSQDEHDIQAFRLTNKPVYITGSAPGGVECFCIIQDRIFKLDVARRLDDKAQYRWFDIFDSNKCFSSS